MAESWLPTTVWYDNLDVLGSEMHSDWRAAALLGLHLEKSVSRLVWLAQGHDFMGYHIAAQSLRDRAMAMSVALDPHLPTNEAPLVRWTLQTETRPKSLLGRGNLRSISSIPGRRHPRSQP